MLGERRPTPRRYRPGGTAPSMRFPHPQKRVFRREFELKVNTDRGHFEANEADYVINGEAFEFSR